MGSASTGAAEPAHAAPAPGLLEPGGHFLSVADYSADGITAVLDLADELKLQRGRGACRHQWGLAGKTLAMIFSKPSTRTRISFEVGIGELGGRAVVLHQRDLQLGRGETVADTARVMSSYVHGVMIRTFRQEEVQEFARHSSVPIINGLTDLLHPCQALADMMTIREEKSRLAGLTLAYVGDGNNVAHSLMLAGSILGMEVRVATPAGREPDPAITAAAEARARLSGGSVTIFRDPVRAVSGADAVYTDTWSSMGAEEVSGQEEDGLEGIFGPYRVDGGLMAKAAKDSIFMHCLPAERGEEVTAEVIDGPRSVVVRQAENRLHVQKAVMLLLMGG